MAARRVPRAPRAAARVATVAARAARRAVSAVAVAPPAPRAPKYANAYHDAEFIMVLSDRRCAGTGRVLRSASRGCPR